MQAGSEVSRVRWARPGAAAYVAFVSLLMAVNLFNLGRPPSLDDGAWLGVAGLIAAWALELGGLRWPRTVLSLVTAAIVPYLAYTFDTEFTRLFLLLLVVWVPYTGNRRDSLVALGLSLLSLAPIWTQLNVSVPWAVGIVANWFAAQAMIAQRRTLVELRAAQASLATQAALAEAERLGRQSLADVRRTVGLLQDPDASGATARPVLAPLPTASDMQTLVDEYARAGMRVELTVEGDASELAAGASLAVYRIAQEALANVAKHATRARTRVELRIDDRQDVLHLRVRDGGGAAELAPPERADSGSGMGLPGMRKRAELLGGSLFAGPDPAGAGWLVEATLPLVAARTASVQR
jgi:anti-sigma regulatory factor (Ser/Thr protein kinase)